MPQYSEMQLSSYVDQIFAKLERLERQLLAVSEKVGVPMEDPAAGMPAEIVELVRSGDRLQAIAKHREMFGTSVEEAKQAIAAL